MKFIKILSLILSVSMIFLCFSGCSLFTPEGYARKHYSYRDALTYAQKLDPDATVDKSSVHDSTDKRGYEFREWDAVIGGVACHVASYEEFIYTLAGEFGSTFYFLCDDRDHIVAKQIINEKQPDWKIDEDHPYGVKWKMETDSPYDAWFSVDTSYITDTPLSEAKPLSDAELETVWQEAYEIYTEYQKYSPRKEINFYVSAPAVFGDHIDGNQVMMSIDAIDDFTEEGKQEFFEEYRKSWELLESGLPISDKP